MKPEELEQWAKENGWKPEGVGSTWYTNIGFRVSLTYQGEVLAYHTIVGYTDHEKGKTPEEAIENLLRATSHQFDKARKKSKAISEDYRDLFKPQEVVATERPVEAPKEEPPKTNQGTYYAVEKDGLVYVLSERFRDSIEDRPGEYERKACYVIEVGTGKLLKNRKGPQEPPTHSFGRPIKPKEEPKPEPTKMTRPQILVHYFGTPEDEAVKTVLLWQTLSGPIELLIDPANHRDNEPTWLLPWAVEKRQKLIDAIAAWKAAPIYVKEGP